MAEKSVSSDSSAPWLLAGLGIAGAGLLIFYLATKPKTTAVQPGQTVGVRVRWKNIGPYTLTQRWRIAIEDTALLASPQEGPWTEYQVLPPGATAIDSPETIIPMNWGAPMKINLRLDTEGDIDEDTIKFWHEYFEIR